MPWISPDRRDGNHRKCNGEAWNEFLDEVTACGCPGGLAGQPIGCECQVSPAPKEAAREYPPCWCGEHTCEGGPYAHDWAL